MSRSKDKGTRFETAAVRYLASRGVKAERVALHGSSDMGDLKAVAGSVAFTVECKDRRRYSVNAAVDEAVEESENAGTSFGVALTHREGCGEAAFGGNLVHMELDTFVDLLGWLR